MVSGTLPPRDLPQHEPLSKFLRSAGVVMIYVNGLTRADIAPGTVFVDEYRPEEKKTHEGQSGECLDEETSVDLGDAVSQMMLAGFTPVRTLAVRRHNGRFRYVIVLVQKRAMRGEDKALTSYQRTLANVLFAENYWDARIYRNPGESGGNFIIEAGNKAPVDKFDRNAKLLVSKGGELIIQRD